MSNQKQQDNKETPQSKTDLDKYIEDCNNAVAEGRIVPNNLKSVINELSDVIDLSLFPVPFKDEKGCISISESEKNYTHLILIESVQKGMKIEHTLSIKKIPSNVWNDKKKRRSYEMMRGLTNMLILHKA